VPAYWIDRTVRLAIYGARNMPSTNANELQKVGSFTSMRRPNAKSGVVLQSRHVAAADSLLRHVVVRRRRSAVEVAQSSRRLSRRAPTPPLPARGRGLSSFFATGEASAGSPLCRRNQDIARKPVKTNALDRASRKKEPKAASSRRTNRILGARILHALAIWFAVRCANLFHVTDGRQSSQPKTRFPMSAGIRGRYGLMFDCQVRDAAARSST